VTLTAPKTPEKHLKRTAPQALYTSPMANFLTNIFEGNLFAITILVKDLEASREFYGVKLELKEQYKDDVSTVFKAGGTMINILSDTQAKELIAPATLSTSNTRTMFTLKCEEIDKAAEELKALNIAILNGPIDRPWGVRTVSFQDPDGIIWELANH
jgi:catechol 2,3-dioxygenase-like lactoylglutathione lyase family enzyme